MDQAVCGDAREPVGAPEVGAQRQAVNNGDNVAANSAPFGSVVRLIFLNGAGDDAGTCTATRSGASRYLTAAHCLQADNLDFVGPGDKMDIAMR